MHGWPTDRACLNSKIQQRSVAVVSLGRKAIVNAGNRRILEAECHAELAKQRGEPVHQGTFYVPSDVTHRTRDYRASRDLQVVNSGGYVVGTKNLSFIDRLRNRSVLYRLGAQPLPGQREHVTIPKGSGGATITWLGSETAQAAESSPTFVQLSATPHTAAGYIELSQLWLDTAGPAGEAFVENTLAADLAIDADGKGINGAGGAEPTGVLASPGIGTASGNALGYSTLVGVQKTVADGNAVVDAASLGYCTNPTEAERLMGRQRFSGTDSALWSGQLYEGEVVGTRALATKQMPNATCLYGDFSSILVPEWGGLAVEVNPFADFKGKIVGVRCLMSMDIVVQHPISFVAITGIT